MNWYVTAAGICGVLSFSAAVIADDRTDYFSNDASTQYEYGNGDVFAPQNDNSFDNIPRVRISKFKLKGFVDGEVLSAEIDGVSDIIEQDRSDRSGLYSVAELQELTRKVTNFYRDQGIILAKAYIPEQRIENGTLTMHLVPGRLESVQIANNDLYSEKTLTQPFTHLIGEPVNANALELALLRFSRYPGVDASSSLMPGESPGTTQLLVSVKDETPFNGYLVFDNHGKKNTGKQRGTLAAEFNNPARNADRLAAQLTVSLNPSNSLSGQFEYELPLDTLDMSFGERIDRFNNNSAFKLRYATSRFDVGGDFEDLGLSGNSQVLDLRYAKNLKITQISNWSVEGGLSLKRSATDANGTTQSEPKLSVLSLATNHYSRDQRWGGGQNVTSATISAGLPDFLGSLESGSDASSGRGNGQGEFAGGDFTKISLNYQRVQNYKEQFLAARFGLQWSGDMLTAQEQYAIGGPNNVRGYPAGDFVADTAIFMSFEYIGYSYASQLSLPVKNLKLAAFFDFAYGTLNNPTNSDNGHPTAMSVGTYGSFDFADQYQAQMDLGIPIGGDDPTDDTKFQVTFSFKRNF